MIKGNSFRYVREKPHFRFISSIFEVSICSQSFPVKFQKPGNINELGNTLLVIY